MRTVITDVYWQDKATLYFFFLYRCFGDITQCTDGYSFCVWLKSDASPTSTQCVMSSGGQTRSVLTGGMALLFKNGKIGVLFSSRILGKKWSQDSFDVPIGQWFHLGISWHPDRSLVTSLNGHFLPKVNGENLGFRNGTIPSYMHLGKPNNGYVLYGNFTIDEWYFWNYVLDKESMTMIYEQY